MTKNVEVKEILNIFKKRWYVLLLSVFIVGGVGVLSTSNSENIMTYQGEAKIFVSKNPEVYKESPLNNITVKSYLEVLRSKGTIEKAIERASVTTSLDSVYSNLILGIQNDSQVISLKLKGESKEDIDKILYSLFDELQYLTADIIPEGKLLWLEEPVVADKPIIESTKSINIAMIIACGIILGIGLTFGLEYLSIIKNKKSK